MTNKKLILSAVTMVLLATSGISFAREASEGPRGEGKGHKNSVDVNGMILAREATEAPRGADNNNHRQRGRNKLTEDAGQFILARHGADDPVGSERPGEVHGQKRGGRNAVDSDSFVIAREASEGPRGEGKGHKNSVDVNGMILAREAGSQNRGRGRDGLTEEAGQFILAREASEGPRGEGKGHKHGVELAVLA